MDQPLLPPSIMETAIYLSSGEYAWKKIDLPSVFEYCRSAAIAILGGEAWVVRERGNVLPGAPTEMIHNLDPERNQWGSIMAQTATHLVYGILPGRNGDSGVFSWDTAQRGAGQSWEAWARSTVDETEDRIRSAGIEKRVIEAFENDVYYALDLTDTPATPT